MAITTYSSAPYNDDFASADKNYSRILFRPGRSLQVRELNQLQSNLQDQIDKFGRHVFKDGDRVLDGYTTYDENIRSVPITFASNASLTAAQLDALKGIEIYKNGASTLSAKILGAESFIGTNNTIYYRLYLKYFGGQSASISSFGESDTLNLGSDESTITLGTNTTVVADATFATVVTSVNALESPGYYGGFFQDEGVFFIKGSFVHTDSQSVFYIKSSETVKLTGNCVFDIVESTVTSKEDTTLLDNSSGTPNFNAPGADRYKVELTLKFVPSDTTGVKENQQRINLLEIDQDQVVKPVRTEYSELGKALAQRTAEESGSYVLKPFKIDVREYLNNEAGNRGKYTDDEIFNSGGTPLIAGVSSTAEAQTAGAKKFVVGIEPSVAYVQGYRVELEDKNEVVVEKGRETADRVTSTGYKIQAVRPSLFIEGCISDGHTNGVAAVDIQALDFSPDDKYYFYDRSTVAPIGWCRIHSIEATGVLSVDYGNADSTTNPATDQAMERIYIYDFHQTGFTAAGESGLSSAEFLRKMEFLSLKPNNTSAAGYTTNDIFGLENRSGFTFMGDGVEDKRTTLVYDLPADGVNSVDSTTLKYAVQKTMDVTTSNAVGSQGRVTHTLSSGKFFSTNAEDYTIMLHGYGWGHTSLGSIYVHNVVISNGGLTITAFIRGADGKDMVYDALDGTLFGPVESSGVKIKTQTTGQTTTTTKALYKGQQFQLGNADVYAIESITHAGNPAGASVDIKSDFILDDGQRDAHYTYGTVSYKGNLNLAASTGNIVITYSYYAHSGSGACFTRNSYTSDGTTLIALEDVPTFGDGKLTDALDFRHNILEDTDALNIFPNTVINVDFEHFLPRLDAVVLTQLGDVKVITGTAAKYPTLPTIPNDSLQLYTINKPGYLYNLSDLEIEAHSHERYTMKDIEGIDDRVKRLEYYTALTDLERDASERELSDQFGARHKSGIFTDGFIGHGAGDSTNSAYKVGINREENSARPLYLSENSRWSYKKDGSTTLQSTATSTTTEWNGETIDSTTVHSGKRANAITLDFIEKTVVNQPFASEHMSVNPYDVATWSGTLELSPSSDEWKDTTHVPDIVQNVEGNNDALLNQIANNPNILGTEWNEWSTNWRGRRWRRRSWWRGSRARGRSAIRRRRRSRRRWWTSRATQVRSGIQTELTANFRKEVIDEEVLDVSFIPFIRSRKVHFQARLLKPNTRFYLFFDDVNISSYAVDGQTFSTFGGGVASNGGTDVVRYDGQTNISGADGVIISDASGDINGWFVVPNNDILRFRTGTRSVRLTDSQFNNKELELSAAETSYHAKGILETKQRTVLSTRELSLTRTRVSDRRNIVVRRSRVWRDPISQTFMIGNESTGLFISSIDIFFQAVDPKIPIELSIVTVENGIPTQNTVPFSKVIKKSGDAGVTIDADTAQAATNFMFDTPVYLEAGIEYAVLLISNSARWRTWVARVGGTNKVPAGVNADKITKNVNLGVLLKSQNASTWTPDQNADLKFKLNRADFKSDAAQTALFTGVCPARGDVTYIDVTTPSSGYLNGPPVVTVANPSSGTNTATAKAYVSEGGELEYIEVTNGGSGYTSSAIPAVTLSAPEAIAITTGQVAFAGDGIISLFGTITDITTGTTAAGASGQLDPLSFYKKSAISRIKNGQAFVYNNGGGTSIGGMSSGTTYYAKCTFGHGESVSDGLEFSHQFAVYSDDQLTSRVTLTGAGNDLQSITPTAAAAATAKINTWKGATFFNIIEELKLPEASTEYTMTVRGDDASTGGGVNETLAYPISPNETFYSDIQVEHDSDSGSSGSYLDTLKLESVLSTTDSKISPLIDLDRISLVSFDNLVNASTEFEHITDEGQSLSRYISKRIKLDALADGVNIIFDLMKPDESTDVKVYVKIRGPRTEQQNPVDQTISGTDLTTGGWDQLGWKEVSKDGGEEASVSQDFSFTEVQYSSQFQGNDFNSFDLSDVDYQSASVEAANNLITERFNEVAVKIVFTSSNPAFAPEIKNLRVITSL
jgi:hypothetical protein